DIAARGGVRIRSPCHGLERDQTIDGTRRNAMQQKLWPSLVRGRIEMLARRLPPGLNQVIGSVELVTLGAILLIAGGIWGFVELADEIAGGEAHAWDRELLLLLRNPLDS